MLARAAREHLFALLTHRDSDKLKRSRTQHVREPRSAENPRQPATLTAPWATHTERGLSARPEGPAARRPAREHSNRRSIAYCKLPAKETKGKRVGEQWDGKAGGMVVRRGGVRSSGPQRKVLAPSR